MFPHLMRSLQFNMFIRMAKTPNPNSLKFLPTAKQVMGPLAPMDFSTIEQATRGSALARRLFRVEGVTQVFFGSNYISVGKNEKANWTEMSPLIFDLIEKHYESGEPIIVEAGSLDITGIKQTDSQTVKLIKQVLVSRVRPTVQDDGGDVQFQSYQQEDGVLKLKMLGSCANCPSSEATLKKGILKMMKHYVGGVKDVIAV